jgi:hypothetical protein
MNQRKETKELRRMLAIIVGLLAGLAGLLLVPLAMAVTAALSPVLSLYQSIAGMAKTARGSASTETRPDRYAEVKKLPEGRRNVEEPRLAAQGLRHS